MIEITRVDTDYKRRYFSNIIISVKNVSFDGFLILCFSQWLLKATYLSPRSENLHGKITWVLYVQA